MANYYLGILSGTSMDAVDVAIVSFTPKCKIIATYNHPIPENLTNQYRQLINNPICSLDFLGKLNVATGELFSEAVNILLLRENLSAENIQAIGSHGQNICHRPTAHKPFSMQIGSPSTIKINTSITTIADFRNNDIAAKGQGAPLAPAFHQEFFQVKHENRIIINIGGISNLTVLPQDLNAQVIGFDCGPGNCLLDLGARKYLATNYDNNGDFAASGNIDHDLLALIIQDQYFQQAPPKSTGTEYFNQKWLNNYSTNFADISPEDIQATLTALTAKIITRDIKNYANLNDFAIYICGGGAHNQTLLNNLSANLAQPIYTTTKLGINPDWVEACLFAWLAKQRLKNIPANLPSVTGANKLVTLGAIY